MKTVTFKKDHEFFRAGTTTTLDDTWADQLLKAKIVTLAKTEEANTVVSSSVVENTNEDNK
jgi:hypothetical protein